MTLDQDGQTEESPSGPSGPRAGFGRRFAAAFLDGILLSIVFFVLSRIFLDDLALYYASSQIVGLVYYSVLEGGASGQTLGKRALGIRVADFRTGGPIGIGRGALRYVARILSAIPLLLGYLWMLWDREKQTWHDKLTSAVVVPASTPRDPRA